MFQCKYFIVINKFQDSNKCVKTEKPSFAENIFHVFQKKEKLCQHPCTDLLTLHPQLFLQEIDPDCLFVALGERSTTVALKIKRVIPEFDKRRICEEVTLSRATGAPIIVWAARP